MTKVAALVLVSVMMAGCSLYQGDGTQGTEDAGTQPKIDLVELCGETPRDFGALSIEWSTRESDGLRMGTIPHFEIDSVTSFRNDALAWIECAQSVHE